MAVYCNSVVETLASKHDIGMWCPVMWPFLTATKITNKSSGTRLDGNYDFCQTHRSRNTTRNSNFGKNYNGNTASVSQLPFYHADVGVATNSSPTTWASSPHWAPPQTVRLKPPNSHPSVGRTWILILSDSVCVSRVAAPLLWFALCVVYLPCDGKRCSRPIWKETA